jgi:hypothetical protein
MSNEILRKFNYPTTWSIYRIKLNNLPACVEVSVKSIEEGILGNEHLLSLHITKMTLDDKNMPKDQENYMANRYSVTTEQAKRIEILADVLAGTQQFPLEKECPQTPFKKLNAETGRR